MDLVIYAGKPADSEPVEHIVTIKPGQGFSSFSKSLLQKGIIRHPFKFRLYARMKRYETQIKAGEYALSPAMAPEKILDIIVRGKVHFHKLTIPEGYNLKQIARIVETSGFGRREDFLDIATNTDFVHQQDIDAATFEGYLFPDTYLFPKDETLEKIISTMVKRFWSAFKPEWKRRSEALGLSIHEVVTLASIIEKESGVAGEQPIISSVFHNRLNRNMRLQSDPTVIYGIEDLTVISLESILPNRRPTIPIPLPGCHRDRLPMQGPPLLKRPFIRRTPSIFILFQKEMPHISFQPI